MTTFANLKSRIEGYLDRTDINSEIGTAINKSIEFYSKYPFWFAETSTTFSTVADQETYGTGDGLPSDLRRIVYLKITISGSDYDLKERPIGWLQDQDPSNNSGQPEYYVFYGSKIYLYPIPDDAYTVTIFYKKNYSALSADGDENDFTTNEQAISLIEAHTLWRIYKYVLHDKEEAEDAKDAIRNEFQALKTISDGLTSIGNYVKPTDF